MSRQFRQLLTISVILFASFAHADTEAPRPSTEGFYPIWENTGFVEKHREMYIGTNGAHYGIMDVAHVGVQPINFIYRSPNAYAKFSLMQGETLHLGAQIGCYYLMDEASRSFFSPMYSSRLDNPDFSVYLIPISLTSTLAISDWLHFHQTLTELIVDSTSGQLDNQAFPGYTGVLEFRARARHSVLLHMGEVGLWKHDFSIIGTSYRYHNSWMEFRIGYFYRLRPEGTQSAPLIGLGFLI